MQTGLQGLRRAWERSRAELFLSGMRVGMDGLQGLFLPWHLFVQSAEVNTDSSSTLCQALF